MSRMDNDPCSAIYRVTIFSLQPWHTGEWLFTVYSTDGNQSAVASTEISTEINVIGGLPQIALVPSVESFVCCIKNQ